MGTRFREKLLWGSLKVVRHFDQRQPDPTELGTDNIRRILVVSSTAIGDTLLSTPAIHSLRQAYPHAHISLLVNIAYQKLFASNPDVNELIPYLGGYRRFFRLAWQLRQARFDIVAIMHGNEPQATPLAYLSGARWRFKLPNTSQFNFLLSNSSPIKTWDDFPHGIDQRLAVAKLAGAGSDDRTMVMVVEPTCRERVTQRLLDEYGLGAESPVVGFQVGASTASRRWRPESYAELGKQLLHRHKNLRILITGSPQEKLLAQQVAKAINSERVIVTAGDIPLHDLPALIERMHCLVTPDTGIMHLAIAVRTPIIGLFAAAHWTRSGPAYDLKHHIVIQKERTCTPCLGKRCKYSAPICMDQISVEEVMAACDLQLTREHPLKDTL